MKDPTQIAIEVAVPQIAGQRSLTGKVSSKGQVCKDIVIWPGPRMTCWDAAGKPSVPPASIIEWKHNSAATFDSSWLREFSGLYRNFVGFAVSSSLTSPPNFKLTCTRFVGGRSYEEWLVEEPLEGGA